MQFIYSVLIMTTLPQATQSDQPTEKDWGEKEFPSPPKSSRLAVEESGAVTAAHIMINRSERDLRSCEVTSQLRRPISLASILYPQFTHSMIFIIYTSLKRKIHQVFFL